MAFFAAKANPIVHELAVTSGTDSDTIHELLFAQSQQISSSNRPNTPLLLKMSNTSHTAPDASLAQPPSPHHPQVVGRFTSASGHLTQCWAYSLCTGKYTHRLSNSGGVRQYRCHGDTSPRDTWNFTRSVPCSSNCAFDNKRKRPMHRKRSQSRW